jgi:hypothetical protein
MMRSRQFIFSILIFLGLVPIILYARSAGASDPTVTPDITIPSTLKVKVTIAEDQDASDGAKGKSVITLGFSTNEISETNTVIFTHGEWISCNGSKMTLGNATNYWFRVDIPYNSWYTCDYHYFLNGQSTPTNIFSVHAAQDPLSPVLLRSVSGNFQVHYTSSQAITDASTCTVQVTATAPNQSTSGDPLPQKGDTYAGSDASGLNGLGNIMMERSCVPINFDYHNAVGDCQCNGSPTKFDAVNVMYTSTASYEVLWHSPGSPTQGTSS